jgi:hypothetical protein
VNGRIVPITELTAAELGSWRDLAEHAIEPNPLFEPGCLVPAAEHLPNGPGIALVIAESEGRFFGCFPVHRVPPNARPSAAWGGVRRPTFTTQVIWRHRFDGTPLLAGERATEAATTLLSVLKDESHARNAGILVLEWLDADGPVASQIAAAAAALRLPLYTHHSWSRPVVRRRPELTYREIHGGKFLRNLGRLRRQLDEKLGSELQLVDRSADASAVDELLAMEAAGYKGRSGVALAAFPGELEWFHEMCCRFRSEGRLVLYCLQAGDAVVAMQLMLRGGEGLFLLELTYDERWAHYRPGLQLHLDAIDRFHLATDAQWLDTCTYEDNETLLRMYPDRRTVSTVLVGIGGRIDRLFLRASVVPYRILGPGSTFRTRHQRMARSVDWAVSKLRILPR